MCFYQSGRIYLDKNRIFNFQPRDQPHFCGCAEGAERLSPNACGITRKEPGLSTGSLEPAGFKDGNRGSSEAVPPDTAKKRLTLVEWQRVPKQKRPSGVRPFQGQPVAASTGGIAMRSTPGYSLRTLRVQELYWNAHYSNPSPLMLVTKLRLVMPLSSKLRFVLPRGYSPSSCRETEFPGQGALSGCKATGLCVVRFAGCETLRVAVPNRVLERAQSRAQSVPL
jgi:hypothetical protein